MKSHHRRSFAGESWVDVPSRFLRRGVWPKHISCAVTAATALDLRSTDDVAELSARVDPQPAIKLSTAAY
jgi:hypothetical protein